MELICFSAPELYLCTPNIIYGAVDTRQRRPPKKNLSAGAIRLKLSSRKERTLTFSTSKSSKLKKHELSSRQKGR